MFNSSHYHGQARFNAMPPLCFVAFAWSCKLRERETISENIKTSMSRKAECSIDSNKRDVATLCKSNTRWMLVHGYGHGCVSPSPTMCIYHARIVHSSSCQPRSCVPREFVSGISTIGRVYTYENKTAHHVHASTEGGVQEGLVTGDHPLATALYQTMSAIILPLCRCWRSMHLNGPVICSSWSHHSHVMPSLVSRNAPSPRSSVHRAFGVRAAIEARGSRA